MTTNAASLDAKTLMRGGPIRWLILGGALLIAAIAIGATLMAENFRERALRNSERELENTVLLLARHFDQQLSDFEVIQKDLIDHIRSGGITTADSFKQRMSGKDVHLMLKSKLSALSYVGGVNVFDADGTLINTSTAWPVPSLNVADRPYFRTFQTDPQAPEMLVEPVHSRISGAWTTVIARKMTGPNGELIGVIGRGIEPATFEKFFASVALAPGASISMHHRNGTLLARYPHPEGMIGHNFKIGAPPDRLKIFDLDQYATHLISPVDGQERLVSSRALANFPIVIVATKTTAAALLAGPLGRSGCHGASGTSSQFGLVQVLGCSIHFGQVSSTGFGSRAKGGTEADAKAL